MSSEIKCRICNRRAADSREHLPPQSSDNTGRMNVRFIKGDFKEGVRHERVHLNNGFWMRIQCQKCNNRLGRIYGSNYSHFVSQLAAAPRLYDLNGKNLVYLRGIYPVRVLKQMFAMFLSIYPSAPPPEWEGLRNFVLKRDALLPTDAPQVYLYRNDCRFGRIVPWCGILQVVRRLEPILLSEISWPPLGIIFCDRPDARFEYMENITHWGQLGFKKKLDAALSLPVHVISHDHPIAFGTPEQVERWRTENGVVWCVAGIDNPELETNTSLILRKQ